MNYSYVNNEIENKNKSDKQGLQYITKYNSITGEHNNVSGKGPAREGFSNLYGNTDIDNKNQSEIDELLKMQQEYQKKLQTYTKTYDLLLSNINEFFELRKSPLINKNIRLSDGKIGYVTSEGIFKHYPNWENYKKTSGKRGCPSDYIQVEATIVDGKVTTTPPFIVGEPMQDEQSCGNEGKNVFSTGTGSPGKETYKGCFKVPSDSDDLVYQDGLGENATFESCKQLAHDSGSSVFSLLGDSIDKLKCYIGSSIDSIRNNENSITNMISWEAPNNGNAISAVFNSAGQLIVKGNISVDAQVNLTAGLQYTVRKGYMDDNVNYFDKDNTKRKPRSIFRRRSLFRKRTVIENQIISQGTTENLTSLSSATKRVLDNNSTKISVEWRGYLKSNVNTDIDFRLTSDDCSYMWIGDNAISNYSRKNAFINNGGLHPAITKTNRFSFDSSKYYPIRIQFGQNKGPNKFSLEIIPSIQGASIQYLRTPSPFSSNVVKPGDKITVLGDLWKSTGPQGNCDPEIGGGIKLSQNITWGGNCNYFTGPNNKSYDIKNGNAYDIVSKKIQRPYNYSYYTVGDGFDKDPAPGCPKNFNALYACGNGVSKEISIDGEAGGKYAIFDCLKENNQCEFLLLVKDNGNVIIVNTGKIKEGEISLILNEEKNAILSIDIPDNSPGIIWSSQTTGRVSIPNKSKSAINGKNKLNFLSTRETLNDGEFIGSPSGNCYLQMIKGRGLILMYSKSNCYEQEGKMYGKLNPPNSITSAAYVIPENDLSNMYKIGYVDRNSNLKPYDNNLITKSNAYIDMGNFRLEGTPIKKIDTNDLNVCKLECSKDPNCDGFTIGNNVCELRNNENMFPNVQRYSDPNQTLYKRSVNVKNNPSCSKTIVPVSVDQYSGYIEGSKMTTNDICSLGIYNKEYYEKLKQDLNNLQTTVDKINSRLNRLSNKDKKILEKYGLTESKLKRDIISINSMRNKYLEFKPKLETVKGMEINTEDEMMSKSYYNMLWSILAIMIVIGGIKMAR